MMTSEVVIVNESSIYYPFIELTDSFDPNNKLIVNVNHIAFVLDGTQQDTATVVHLDYHYGHLDVAESVEEVMKKIAEFNGYKEVT